MNLTDQFQKFAGREVTFKTLYGSPEPNVHDPVIAEMNKTAAHNGLHFHFKYPGTFMEHRLDETRISVDLLQNEYGKWLVGQNFEIG
jgi:hypothetical protein